MSVVTRPTTSQRLILITHKTRVLQKQGGLTLHQFISRILKSKDITLEYCFTDLEVDVGCENELVQDYDSLTYLIMKLLD